MNRDHTGLRAPNLERVADCVVEVGAPIDVGESPLGQRRLVPILGGRLLGPALFGEVLPGGADFQLISSPTQMAIQARYVVELEQGVRIYIENTGLRIASADTLSRLQAGESVDPELVYFRTTPRFETASSKYAWLMSALFVGTGVRYPERVELSFFRVA